MSGIYTVTGGPCVGKSSVIKELARRGYGVVREPARAIIAREQRRNARDPAHEMVVPWERFIPFQYAVGEAQVGRLRRTTEMHDTIFSDRNLGDILAYTARAKESGLIPSETIVPSSLYSALKEQDHRRVFLLDPLPYSTDGQRKEDPEEAEALHEGIHRAYDRLGCDIVRVPVFPDTSVERSVARRADHILELLVEDSCVELEEKHAVSDIHALRERLAGYHVERVSTGVETTRLYASDDGLLVRLREQDGAYAFGLKGPRRADGGRFEWTPALTREEFDGLDAVLRRTGEYVNRTEEYVPVGDQGASIALDVIEDLGTFVEIEARTQHQIDLWKQRLGIRGEPISASYADLIRRDPAQLPLFQEHTG